MGLFSDVGRTVEKTKRAFTDSKRAEYVCLDCEESLDENYEYCPRCGEDSVEPAA